MGIVILFRVNKCFLRVAKVYLDFPITLNLLKLLAFWGHGILKTFLKGCTSKKFENPLFKRFLGNREEKNKRAVWVHLALLNVF